MTVQSSVRIITAGKAPLGADTPARLAAAEAKLVVLRKRVGPARKAARLDPYGSAPDDLDILYKDIARTKDLIFWLKAEIGSDDVTCSEATQ
ncbi:MAG TPA: hypothetical protein VII91_01170 [Bauldia sp.]